MDEDVVLKNELGILSLLEQNEVDFCLLQEVDRKSKRSHFHAQFERISEALGSGQSFFGLNYHVRRIPVPNLEPFNVYGKVFSGLSTHARPAVSRALRITLPGEFSWPDKVFQLDRCMLVTRTPHPLGEVVVVNLHLSAYDETGVIKAQQMAFLRDFVLEEFVHPHGFKVRGFLPIPERLGP